MPLHGFRSVAREVRAVSRNYLHAALLRRHIRARYGAVVTARPSVLIGEVLAVMCEVQWTRVTILAVLIVVGVCL